MIRISLFFLFLAFFLISCGERNGVTQDLGIGGLTEEFKAKAKDGTLMEILKDERLQDGAEVVAEWDDEAFEYYKDPERCPYGTLSWSRFWYCKNGKLIKRE